MTCTYERSSEAVTLSPHGNVVRPKSFWLVWETQHWFYSKNKHSLNPQCKRSKVFFWTSSKKKKKVRQWAVEPITVIQLCGWERQKAQQRYVRGQCLKLWLSNITLKNVYFKVFIHDEICFNITPTNYLLIKIQPANRFGTKKDDPQWKIFSRSFLSFFFP